MTLGIKKADSNANRWLAHAESYEPDYDSIRWGSCCILFEFTSREFQAGDWEIHPSVAYHADAIDDAEAGNEALSPLFSSDQSYAIVVGMMIPWIGLRP